MPLTLLPHVSSTGWMLHALQRTQRRMKQPTRQNMPELAQNKFPGMSPPINPKAENIEESITAVAANYTPPWLCGRASAPNTSMYQFGSTTQEREEPTTYLDPVGRFLVSTQLVAAWRLQMRCVNFLSANGVRRMLSSKQWQAGNKTECFTRKKLDETTYDDRQAATSCGVAK